MHKIKALDPADVKTPPPWEREEIHWTEGPAVIKHWYGLTYSQRTIYNWMKRGIRGKDGQRVYLKGHAIAGRLFCRLVDLRKFVRET